MRNNHPNTSWWFNSSDNHTNSKNLVANHTIGYHRYFTLLQTSPWDLFTWDTRSSILVLFFRVCYVFPAQRWNICDPATSTEKMMKKRSRRPRKSWQVQVSPKSWGVKPATSYNRSQRKTKEETLTRRSSLDQFEVRFLLESDWFLKLASLVLRRNHIGHAC